MISSCLLCHAGSASREDPSKGGTVGANSVAAAIGESHVAIPQQQQQHQQAEQPAAPMTPSLPSTGAPSALSQRPTSVQRNQQLVDGFQTDGEWKKWNEDRERKRETWINDPEWIRVESWLDEHPDFCLDYFLRFVSVFEWFFCFFLLGINSARSLKNPSITAGSRGTIHLIELTRRWIAIAGIGHCLFQTVTSRLGALR